MAVVLALASAVVYGAADFLGGLASRRTSVFGVVALSQVVGLVALLALLPWLGGPVDGADLTWGAAAGVAGAGGLVVFFRTLARGVMSVIAPVTAVTAAAVPVVVGLFYGDTVGVWAAVGIGLALVAVVLVSAEGGLSALRSARPAALAPALPLVAVSGIGDMSANALFLLATQADGQLAITGVLASLYPVSTVVLAQVVLRERLVGAQVAGLLAAATAVVLITLPA